jgi:hypothetical protein
MHLLLLVCAVASAANARLVAQEKPVKEYFEPFKGKPQRIDDFVLVGPNANQCVKHEKEGLRITLPTGFAGERPKTGVATTFPIGGDFEVTITYEVLKPPAPEDTGKLATRLTLGITLQAPGKNLANFSQRLGLKTGSVFVAWASHEEQPGKDTVFAKMFPVTAPNGRLRLTRAAGELSFSAAEGNAEEFVLLNQRPFGTQDVREIRISGCTAGPNSALDLRICDLRIKATKFGKPQFGLQPAPPARALAARVNLPLRNSMDQIPLTRLMGPDARDLLLTDPLGLRFKIPADRSDGSEVGVESQTRLRGDFEIALHYDLLSLPQPGPELGTGVALLLRLDTPDEFKARLGRTRKADGAKFGANFITLGPNGKEDFQGLRVWQANDRASTGQLRLVRTGTKLSYQGADGEDGPVVLAVKEVGTADVVWVRAMCATGWRGGVEMEVRLRNLDIRAEQIPTPATPPAPPLPVNDIAAVPITAPKGDASGSWLMAFAVIALVLLSLAAIGIGGLWWLLCRRRSLTTRPAPAGARTFACPECGRNLKASAKLIGKKVRCARCGKAVAVPA